MLILLVNSVLVNQNGKFVSTLHLSIFISYVVKIDCYDAMEMFCV